MTKLTERDLPFSPDQAREISGVEDPRVAHRVVNYLANSLSPLEDDLTPQGDKIAASVEMVKNLTPRDTLEGMLIAQIVCSQNLASELMRRATRQGESTAIREESLRQARKFMALFQSQTRTLIRYRGTPHALKIEERLEAHRAMSQFLDGQEDDE